MPELWSAFLKQAGFFSSSLGCNSIVCGLSPASHRGGPGFTPGQSLWDLWWTQWVQDWFFSKCVRFPLAVLFRHWSILVFIYRASTVYCPDTDRIIKCPLHLYLFYWTSFYICCLIVPHFVLTRLIICLIINVCYARPRHEVESRMRMVVPKGCRFLLRPGTPTSERFGHEIRFTDLQKYNAEFLSRTS